MRIYTNGGGGDRLFYSYTIIIFNLENITIDAEALELFIIILLYGSKVYEYNCFDVKSLYRKWSK